MNLLTNQMNKMTDMMRKTDGVLKKMGKEPYRAAKLTAKGKADLYKSLTEADIYEKIEKYGVDAVNKWLDSLERGGAKWL